MAYIPPNKRERQTKQGQNRRAGRLNRNLDEFPAINGKLSTPIETEMQYAAAVKYEEPTVKDEERLEPGWVHLKSNTTTGKVEWRGGSVANTEYDEAQRRDIVLETLVDKWQRERDEVTDVLDQASPYWGMKNLKAPLSDDDLSDTEDEVESELESDDEYSEGWISN